jgi:hypothetical protein
VAFLNAHPGSEYVVCEGPHFAKRGLSWCWWKGIR